MDFPIANLSKLEIKELNRLVREQQLDEDQRQSIKRERRKMKVREYSKQKYARSKDRFKQMQELKSQLMQEYKQIVNEIDDLKYTKAALELIDTEWADENEWTGDYEMMEQY